MPTPKDKLNKAHDQKVYTSGTRASWQEVLDRNVSIPASRSVEAAAVLRGFAGSWAATYELGQGAYSETDGPLGSPAVQRKQNHIGRPGMPEINFRPYDWGTHRFGPKGPSLLGHPISFEVVGPTDKTILYDWQWRATDNTLLPGVGDTLQIDFDTGTGDDFSLRTPETPGPAVDTKVQTSIGGGVPTTFTDYYGFSDVVDHNGGLYMVVTSGGLPGALAYGLEGGVGDGTIGGQGIEGRQGCSARVPSSYYEIFRVVEVDDATKTVTLDYNKRLARFFDMTTGAMPIFRSVVFIRPVAARLQVVPGSGSMVFAALPPDRALLDDTLPPYHFWTQTGVDAAQWNPWSTSSGFVGNLGNLGGTSANFFLKPQLPIDVPIYQTELAQPDSFTTVAVAQAVGLPYLQWPVSGGYVPGVDDGYDRVLHIFEVEYLGDAITYDSGAGNWPADPGYEWLFGPHEVNRVEAAGAYVHLSRVSEYNPDTGVPFWTPENATEPDYVAGVNDGMRMKASWHETIRTIWTDTHPNLDKISAARLTNLIDPSWITRPSLKQLTSEPSTWVNSLPDRAIFDTSTSNNGVAGSNADPGCLMDLGFRMVLFPAKQGGAGQLVPDFSRPIESREVVIDPAVTDEDQWVDIDYSAGIISLSHAPAAGGDILPNGVIGTYIGTVLDWTSLAFATDGAGNETITRTAGSWITEGFSVGQKVVIQNAGTPANNLTCVIREVTALTLSMNSIADDEAFGVTFTNDAADGTATIHTGDNQRGEVVLFASFVPYSREPSQYGAGVRVTAGLSGVEGGCATEVGASADMFSQRRFWRLAGTNAVPQVITSGEGLTITLEGSVDPVDLPSHGYIEIMRGTGPEGTPALKDADSYSVSTFGYFWQNTVALGNTQLEHCWGGGDSGVAVITIDDDNPHVAVLRRDLALPSDLRGRVGTDYRHDVTYGFASRASAIRFQHARLRRTLDGSVIIEGLERLAETHSALFDDVLTSNVLTGFTISNGGGGIAEVALGTVLIEGVRSQMPATSVDLSGEANGTYYIYIEPRNGDPGCPNCSYQAGLPLSAENHVLVGLAQVAGGLITEVVQLQKKLQDIDLRDDILVGSPTGGQPHYSSGHPHFEELADAVAYACEVMRYREVSGSDGTNIHGGRALRIKVVGPTNENASKLPIQFTTGGITIEGSVWMDGTHAVGAVTENQTSTVAWDDDVELFDLNGQEGLIFRDLVLEFRDTGQAAPTGFKRVAFTSTSGDTSRIRIENVHLVGFLETAAGPHQNLAQAMVGVSNGNHSHWVVEGCTAHVSEAGVYFGGSTDNGTTVASMDHLRFDNCRFTSNWTLAALTTVEPNVIHGLTGPYNGGLSQPEPYGGFIFLTTAGTTHCTVSNCTVEAFAGYGILDNGNEHNLYAHNQLNLLGDIGIYSGVDWMDYFNNTDQGLRIEGNVVLDAHELPQSGGGVGRQTQIELAGIAGSGVSTNAEKRAIDLENGQGAVLMRNTASVAGGAAAVDYSIYLDDSSQVVTIGNQCLYGIGVAAATSNGVVADNIILGRLTVAGAGALVSNNYVVGNTTFTGSTGSAILGNIFEGDANPFGASSTISSNVFLKASAVTFGDSCAITGNQGSSTVWNFGAGCTVSGNNTPTTDYFATGDEILICGNLFGAMDVNLSIVKPMVGLSLIGNFFGDFDYTETNGELEEAVIVGNSMAQLNLDNGTAGQAFDNCTISGNFCDGAVNKIAGGTGVILNGNVFAGASLVLGDVANTCTFSEGVVSNNRFRISTSSGDFIPDNGGGGGETFDYCLELDHTSSWNVIEGNQFRSGGVHVGGSSHYNTISNNTFRTQAGKNVGSFIEGDGNSLAGNTVHTDWTAEDNLWYIAGDGNALSGNTLWNVAFWNTGSNNVLNGNRAVKHTNMTYALYGNGPNAVTVGNSLDGEVHLDALAVTNVFSSNLITATTGLDNITVDGDFSVISNNRVSGVLLVDGAEYIAANGNVITDRLDLNGPNVTANSNVVSAGTIRTWLSGTLDSDWYVLVGNLVSGDILTQSAASGTGTGIVLGNISDEVIGNTVATPQAIPATNHVVLGNKVRNAGTAVYTVDPTTDSVGSNANSLISDFNVGE